MKLLWLSDSPTVPSGFGNITRFVCDGLARLGHEVHILGWQTSGPSRPWNGATLHGIGWHPLGADVLLSYLYRLRPDFLITLADIWWLTFLTDPSIEQFFNMTSTRWVLYFPIDGHRLDGTLPLSWVEMLRRTDAPVAMSRYGQRLTSKCGVPCDYIPHGVETSIFRPASDSNDAKRRLGYENRFVILSDARNQPRKMLPRLLTIFERFARNKSDVILHLHCDPRDPASAEDRYSYRIDADVRALGVEDRVRFTRDFTVKTGLSLDDLVCIYQAADVHLLASTGEGFGLPTLQAASCGVVPIAPAYTANLELVEAHGAVVKVAEFVPDEFGIGRAFVDVDDAAARIEEFYQNRTLLHDRSHHARAFAESYDWSHIIPLWDALLKRHAGSKVSQRRYAAGQRVEILSIGRQATTAGDHRMNTSAGYARGLMPANPERTDNTTLRTTVRKSFTAIPVGVNITLTVSEQRLGEMARQVLDDAGGDPGSPRLNIPIARTERDDGDRRARERSVGSVYLDIPCTEGCTKKTSRTLFLALCDLFPVLREWSPHWPRAIDGTRLETSAGGDWYSIQETDSKVWRCIALAESILAIDLDGQEEELPVWTAYFGVPTIGLSENRWQRLFWPKLSMEMPNDPAALHKARDVLTDYAATAAMTRNALDAFDLYAPASLVREVRYFDAMLTRRSSVQAQAAAPAL